MLSGVTGGVFPPPPQASSNPDRKKLDTKARELNRITSSQRVRKNFAFAFCVCGKSPGGPSCFCWRCLPRLPMEWHAGGMRKRSTHSRTSRNTLFPSVVACKDYVEAKVQMDSRRRSRPHVTRQQGNRGQEISWGDTPTASALLPLLGLFCGYAADHCNASAERTRWMRSS